MIQSKSDLQYYLKCDEIARFHEEVSIIKKILCGKPWRFNVLLRKMEYNENCRTGLVKKAISIVYKFKMRRLSEKTGWFIGTNVFGPGLCVVHIGPVIVNGHAKFGSNCKLQAMVNIGANAGGEAAPQGGDMVYFGPGAKAFGDIKLGSNVCVGANAVVNKSFEESNITIAGVPAKVVSKHGCDHFVIDACSIVKQKYSHSL